jgi:hypothetical protein
MQAAQCVPPGATGPAQSVQAPLPAVAVPGIEVAEVTPQPTPSPPMPRVEPGQAVAAPPAATPTVAPPPVAPAASAQETAEASRDNSHYDMAEIGRPGAYAHSEASVEAPITAIYPVGKQLRILAYRNGWVQLQDAASGQSGWVYQIYVAPAGAAERREVASLPAVPSAAKPSQERLLPQKASDTSSRWAANDGAWSLAPPSEPRRDPPRPRANPRAGNLADLYLRQFYRGY